MAEDNAATAVFRSTSDEINYLLSSAFDHLNVVRDFVERLNIPSFASYTLIRSAIESSAYGLWLLEPKSTDKRVMRLLDLQWDRRVLVDTHTKAVGTHTPENTAWMKAMLTYIKDQRPGLVADRVKRPPTTTHIFLETDELVVTEGMNGLGVWRSCSGVTHGNQQFASGLMMTPRTGTNVYGQPIWVHQSSLSALSMMLGPAVAYLLALVARARAMSQPRSGSGPFIQVAGGPPSPKRSEN